MGEVEVPRRALEGRDPVLVLRRAWSEIRLVRLRELVDETIVRLESTAPEQVLGRGLDELEQGSPDSPVNDALGACRAELREECGMPGSSSERAAHGALVRRHLADVPRWTAPFREALERYRELAGRLLEGACRVAPETAAGGSDQREAHPEPAPSELASE